MDHPMIYVASGWFKPGHLEELEKLETILRVKHMKFFSPRLKSNCPPDADKSIRRNTFFGNVKAINACGLVFARVDDYDPGTVWEMGYAYGRAPIVAWSLVPDRKLNLMLAEACDGFVNGWVQILDFFNDGQFDLKVAQQWKGAIE